jgi:hypothetical protein
VEYRVRSYSKFVIFQQERNHAKALASAVVSTTSGDTLSLKRRDSNWFGRVTDNSANWILAKEVDQLIDAHRARFVELGVLMYMVM